MSTVYNIVACCVYCLGCVVGLVVELVAVFNSWRGGWDCGRVVGGGGMSAFGSGNSSGTHSNNFVQFSPIFVQFLPNFPQFLPNFTSLCPIFPNFYPPKKFFKK